MFVRFIHIKSSKSSELQNDGQMSHKQLLNDMNDAQVTPSLYLCLSIFLALVMLLSLLIIRFKYHQIKKSIDIMELSTLVMRNSPKILFLFCSVFICILLTLLFYFYCFMYIISCGHTIKSNYNLPFNEFQRDSIALYFAIFTTGYFTFLVSALIESCQYIVANVSY